MGAVCKNGSWDSMVWRESKGPSTEVMGRYHVPGTGHIILPTSHWVPYKRSSYHARIFPFWIVITLSLCCVVVNTIY